MPTLNVRKINDYKEKVEVLNVLETYLDYFIIAGEIEL